jgi:hypothetical protein
MWIGIQRQEQLKQSEDRNMKRSLVLGSVLAAGALWLVPGCSTTSRNMAESTGTPAVEQKTGVMAASGEASAGGLACSQCGCVHFEPLSSSASTCRMCDHGFSNHTRQ